MQRLGKAERQSRNSISNLLHCTMYVVFEENKFTIAYRKTIARIFTISICHL